MNADLLIVLLLLGAAILMFAVNRPRVDAVALIAMVALPFTGVITVNEAIAGFANPNIVLIGAMFVIGEALARTGVARRIGDWLVTRGGDQPWRQLSILMLTVGLLGSVMSSTGVVAMFIPVVMRIASRTRIAPSQLILPTNDVTALCEQFKVDLLPSSGRYFIDRSRDVGMVEVVLPEESRFVRKTVAEAELLSQSELTVVGVRRGKVARKPFNLRQVVLKVGDTLLLAGPWRTIRKLQEDSHNLVVLNLPREFAEVLPAASKAPYAVLTLAVVVALMATGIVPNVQAALIGCLMMGFFGCINLDQAYRSIQMKSLIMIVGMMPFAMALDRTGGVNIAAHAVVALTANTGTYAILALLFAITVILGLFIVNTANAVLMIPVALAIAKELQVSPYPFAMIVALAASSAFMTPISPINTLVATAGNYSFADFIRIGLPLTLIVMVVSVLMVPWVFPL